MGRFECDGDELFLEECSMMFMSVDSCPGGEAVIDCGRGMSCDHCMVCMGSNHMTYTLLRIT